MFYMDVSFRQVQRHHLLKIRKRMIAPLRHLFGHRYRKHAMRKMQPPRDGGLIDVLLEAVAHLPEIPPAPKGLQHVTSFLWYFT